MRRMDTAVDKRERRFERTGATDEGFSVIEMMIAVVVIAVGLVSIVGISAYVSRTNMVSNHLSVLATAAQDQVDRLRTARWTSTTEDPMVTVGGSIPYSSPTSTTTSSTSSEPSSSSMSLMSSSYESYSTTTSSAQTTGQTSQQQYSYSWNPDEPHRAVVANTPIGDLRVDWQVRQGGTPDLRYVTIRVAQVNASPLMRDGFTVTTMIKRN